MYDFDLRPLIFILIVLGVVFGFGIHWLSEYLWTSNSCSQTEAIAHHAAHYDAQSGKFTWNDEQVTK